jgi:hypothetical protein
MDQAAHYTHSGHDAESRVTGFEAKSLITILYSKQYCLPVHVQKSPRTLQQRLHTLVYRRAPGPLVPSRVAEPSPTSVI